MAEADPEHRHLANQAADGLHAAGEHLRIAGSVGEEDAVGAVGEDLGRGDPAGEDRHPATTGDQMPGDVPLHPVVEGDDMLHRAGGSDIRIDAPLGRLHQRRG